MPLSVLAETMSRSPRCERSARPPQKNSIREPPRKRSAGPTAIMPISPVRLTCVPPQADKSKSSTSIRRRTPSRRDSLRSGRRAASSASANLIVTGRSCPYDPVRFLFRALDFRGRYFAREIDGGAVRAQVKAHRANAEDSVEGGRQDVLTGVLLHVIEAPVPIDAAVTPAIAASDRRATDALAQHVEDRAVVLVDDVGDRSGANGPRVERLAA